MSDRVANERRPNHVEVQSLGDAHVGEGANGGTSNGGVGEDLGRLVFQTEPDNNGKLYGVTAKHGQELPDLYVQVGLQPFIVFHEGGLKK